MKLTIVWCSAGSWRICFLSDPKFRLWLFISGARTACKLIYAVGDVESVPKAYLYAATSCANVVAAVPLKYSTKL